MVWCFIPLIPFYLFFAFLAGFFGAMYCPKLGLKYRSCGEIYKQITGTVGADMEISYIRGCYYDAQAADRAVGGKYTLDKYEPELCTHIFYAFATITDLKIKYTVEQEQLYRQFTDLKAKQPSLKTLISVGGSAQDTFLLKTMVATHASRAAFIAFAYQFIKKYNFDGIDIFWEYPDARDKLVYAALFEEMKAYFKVQAKFAKQPPFLITAAVAANFQKIDAGYDGKTIGKAVDFINVMTYNLLDGQNTHTAFNSPLRGRGNDRGAIADVATKWEELGVPKHKILIGLAAYGRGFNVSDANAGVGAAALGPSPSQPYTNTEGFAAYFEICDLIDKQGLVEKYDDNQKAVAAVGHGLWFGYNDVQSVTAILEHVKTREYGGAFIWSLDLDDFEGKCKASKGLKHPLANAMKAGLATATVTG